MCFFKEERKKYVRPCCLVTDALRKLPAVHPPSGFALSLSGPTEGAYELAFPSHTLSLQD